MQFHARPTTSSSRFRSVLKGTLGIFVAVLALGLGACDDEEITDTPTTHDLAFSGDDSFGGAHGDQTITVIVETEAGTEVATDDGTVSAADPAFAFEFTDILEAGESYVIKYWIDSNFGDGTEGVCDEPSDDHQWLIDAADDASLANVSGAVTIVDTHRPTDVEDVCSTL